MNNSIYQIGEDYLHIMHEIEENDGEITDELMDRLEQNEEDFDSKASNYIKMIKYWESESDVIDAEIKRLSNLKKSKGVGVSRLKGNLHSSLLNRGLDKLDLGLFKLSFRKSTGLIIDNEDLIPEDYKEVVETTKIDKNAIKSAIKAGGEVDGAFLETRQNLQIK